MCEPGTGRCTCDRPTAPAPPRRWPPGPLQRIPPGQRYPAAHRGDRRPDVTKTEIRDMYRPTRRPRETTSRGTSSGSPCLLLRDRGQNLPDLVRLRLRATGLDIDAGISRPRHRKHVVASTLSVTTEMVLAHRE